MLKTRTAYAIVVAVALGVGALLLGQLGIDLHRTF